MFDNAYRFVKDSSLSRPSRIALSAYWSHDREAVVTLAGLSPISSGGELLTLNRDDLARALQRDSAVAGASKEVNAVQNYLMEHRDVKPLAEVCINRSRYVGITNTGDVANWATLDSGVTVAPVDMAQLGEPQQVVGHDGLYELLSLGVVVAGNANMGSSRTTRACARAWAVKLLPSQCPQRILTD